MTSVPFTGGAIDLSALKPTPPAPAGASWVVNADEQSFESAVQLSTQHPVVLEFWSPRANAEQFSDDLQALANEAQGNYLLVRVNIDTSPQLAQALQIQAVPMVVGVLAGQMVPLFQGTTDRATAKQALDQLVQIAQQNGVSGKAKPVMDEDADQSGPDPRFEAADAAIEAGDFAKAVEEFDKLLAANPADAEASAGKAQAELLLRVQAADPAEVLQKAETNPDDVEAQLAAADLEIASGRLDPAFARLIDVVRRTSGDDREKVRLRLLQLFETVGATDPAVLKARRDLMSALF